jgi:cyclophilin family peptidyl-prolyl cis-trans isomerase
MEQSCLIFPRDGSGGDSIYEGRFKDEKFGIWHDRPGVLSMANSGLKDIISEPRSSFIFYILGMDSNGSQFFITLMATPWLDTNHVAFGLLIDGYEALDEIQNVPVDQNNRPLSPVTVHECGLNFYKQ